jgi:hypothetical protein
MPREDYGNSEQIESSASTFVENAIVWLAKKSDGITVGSHDQQPVSKYTDQIKVIPPKDLEGQKDINVYFINAHTLFDEESVKAIIEFVKNGGGLFACGHAYAWNSAQDKKNVYNYPGNR